MRVRTPLLAAICLPAAAHMVSMSTGELRVEGRTAVYELRMPTYELAHVQNAERELFDHIHFDGAGGPAKLTQKTCRAQPDAYVCTATFEFPGDVDVLTAQCTFYAITVPNHVHVLRAYRGDKTDQAVFDVSFPKAEIRFRPPTTLEVAVTQIGAGVLRGAAGPAQLLFLAALALAARSRRELAALAGMFVLGQALAAVGFPLSRWQPAPRFVEAACALTIAYLAVEILLLPEAGKRWLVVGVLGMFHGLAVALFVAGSNYSAGLVLTGAGVTELLLAALFWFLWSRLARMAHALRPVTVGAGALLVTGMVWFVVRLRG